MLYKYPRSSQTDFRKDIHHHLRPVIDLNAKLVILGDFNIQINSVNTEFVEFMETLFRCIQQIKQCTTDSGSILDLIFSNCEAVLMLLRLIGLIINLCIVPSINRLSDDVMQSLCIARFL